MTYYLWAFMIALFGGIIFMFCMGIYGLLKSASKPMPEPELKGKLTRRPLDRNNP